MSQEFNVEINEDEPLTIMARIATDDDDATGAATGADGEGYFLRVADIDSLTCKVFDLDGEDPDTPIATLSLVVADVIFDTPKDTSTNVIWTIDEYGYNFKHKISHEYFPIGDRRYRAEYVAILSNPSADPIRWSAEGMAKAIRSS